MTLHATGLTNGRTTWVTMAGGVLAALLAMAGCGEILGVETWSPGDGGAGGAGGDSASAGTGGGSSSTATGTSTCVCVAKEPSVCTLASPCDDPNCVFTYYGPPDAPGNCKANACDANGATKVVEDPDDAKPDTSCIAYACMSGMNIANKSQATTPCQENGKPGFCSPGGHCLTDNCAIDCCCVVSDPNACAPSTPSHCCNGIHDATMGELFADCGGTCPLCGP